MVKDKGRPMCSHGTDTYFIASECPICNNSALNSCCDAVLREVVVELQGQIIGPNPSDCEKAYNGAICRALALIAAKGGK